MSRMSNESGQRNPAEQGQAPKSAATAPADPGPRAKDKRAQRLTVHAVQQLTPEMVRISFEGAQFGDLGFSDHYLKFLFPAEDADYGAGFDPDEIRATRPKELWPVTRTYTIRDYADGILVVDFVTHGDEGLAGPWARSVQPGDQISIMGPGGKWGPSPDAAAVLLVGDESAVPAIARAIEYAGQDTRLIVFCESGGAETEIALPEHPRAEVTWVHRPKGSIHGRALAEAVLAAELPTGSAASELEAFVHGNALMIKELRRHLFVDLGVDKHKASISGYWRTGHTDEQWRASKKEFNAQLEAEEEAAAR